MSTPIPKFESAARSDRGYRSQNQDNFLIINAKGQSQSLFNEQIVFRQKQDWPSGHIRLVVADGMGGHQHGREAAEALVDAIYAMPFQDTLKKLYTQLKQIHQNLYQLFERGPKRPGSTLVMAEITPRGLGIIANIGDSRAYHCQNGEWKQLTSDHTSTEFAWRDKLINAEEYKLSIHRPTTSIAQAMIFGSCGIIADEETNKLLQYLPGIRIDKQDLFYIPLVPGDRLWLASDGLWSHNQNNQCQMPLLNPNIVIKQLLAQQHQNATSEGSKDNITSVFLSV